MVYYHFIAVASDSVEQIAFKFQRICGILLIIGALDLIINIAFSAVYGFFGFIWLPFFFVIVFVLGFLGARQRNALFLIIYFIGSIIILVLAAILLLDYIYNMTVISQAIQELNLLGITTLNNQFHAALGLILVVFFITLVYFAFHAVSLQLAWRLRQLLIGSTVSVTGQPTVVVTGQPVVMTQPMMNQPMMYQPGMNQPMMNQPGMNQPMMYQPGMNQPMMNQPGMNQPMMNQPGMNQPMMYQPGMTNEQPMMTNQPVVMTEQPI